MLPLLNFLRAVDLCDVLAHADRGVPLTAAEIAAEIEYERAMLAEDGGGESANGSTSRQS